MQVKEENGLVCVVYDKKTGEVLEQRETNGDTIIKFEKVKRVTPKQREYLENERDKQALSRSLGGFIMVFYFNNETLFNKNTISKATITRLMMLATYLDFNNKLVIETPKTKKQAEAVVYMSKKDMQEKLCLKDSVFRKFYKEIIELGILIKSEYGYSMSTEFFYKGEIKTKKSCVTSNYAKVYINTIRQIYHGTDAKSHVTLSYIFQLIPCVHFRSNYVCKDSAKSMNGIEYMNLEDICSFLGLSTNKGNMSKFKKDIKSIRIKHHDNKYYLFNEVVHSNSLKSAQRFAMNPLLINSISNHDEMKSVMKSLFIG